VTSEVSREVRLVVEAHAGGDLGHGLSLEEPPPRGVDTTGKQVTVRGDPEGAGETPLEVRGRCVEDASGLGQGDPVGEVLVEQIPEIGGDVAGSVEQRLGPGAEMGSDL
jgi:hypothetical protein